MSIEDGKTNTACQRTIKVLLSSLTSIYSVASFVLFIMSACAWQKAYHRSHDTSLCSPGDPNCSTARWALYGFMTMGALITFVTSGLIALRGTFFQRSGPVDPVFVFRGMFFTLLIMAPLVFIGWTSPSFILQSATHSSVSGRGVCPDGSNDCPTKPIPGSTTWDMAVPELHAGVGGTFVLESSDPSSNCGKPAMIMMHINLALGVLVAGLSCALAPMTGHTGWMDKA